MKADQRLYQSYLLRIWKESVDIDWRASVQNVATGDCHYFSNLPALVAYLQAQAASTVLTQDLASNLFETTLVEK